MLIGFQKIEIYISFVSGGKCGSAPQSPQGLRHLPDIPGVTILLTFQDGKCCFIHYTQYPRRVGKVAKVVALPCFKEWSQKPEAQDVSNGILLTWIYYIVKRNTKEPRKVVSLQIFTQVKVRFEDESWRRRVWIAEVT